MRLGAEPLRRNVRIGGGGRSCRGLREILFFQRGNLDREEHRQPLRLQDLWL